MDKTSLASFILNKYGQRLSTIRVKETSVTAATVRNGFDPWLMFYTDRKDDPHAVAGTDGELALKCGALATMLLKIDVFFKPSLTNDPGWVGIMMSEKNDRTIKDLIDSAWRTQGHGPQTIKYIDLTEQDDATDNYQPEFITGRPKEMAAQQESPLPLPLRKMKESYNYQIPLAHRQEVNFYRQGQMMSEYTDDFDGFAELYRNTPDYHGLTNEQLRTYFTLRTQWRKKKFPKFKHGMGGYLMLYMSELANCIGCESPTAAFDQLRRFQRHYHAHFVPGSRPENFPRDMVLYYGLDHRRAAKVFQEELTVDKQWHILRYPEKHSADELLGIFDSATTAYQKCRLYKEQPQRFTTLFQLIWQQILAQPQSADLVKEFFPSFNNVDSGRLFAGLVFDDRIRDDRVYQLDSMRTYRIAGLLYNSSAVATMAPNKGNIKRFFHEIDRATRIVFQIGRPLKEQKINAQVKQAIKEGLAALHQQMEQEKLAKVPIHLGELDQIRDDAAATQEQLLTDEEVDDQPAATNVDNPITILSDGQDVPETPADQSADKAVTTPEKAAADAQQGADTDLPDLTEAEWFFLRALVNHQPYEQYLKKRFLMASLVADQVNEKLLDEIGDTVIEFDDNDQPRIVEDYLADVKQLLKEKEE